MGLVNLAIDVGDPVDYRTFLQLERGEPEVTVKSAELNYRFNIECIAE